MPVPNAPKSSRMILFLSAISLLFLFGYFVFAAPAPGYVSPTLSDNRTTNLNWTFANITSSENLNQSLLEWGNSSGFTNVSMANDSLANWHANITDIVDGAYNYTIWAQNATGNWNQSARRFVYVDSMPPYGLYACQNLTIENGSYVLMQNVSSAGTCFTIKANNITLDGAGYTINYSKNIFGHAIDNSLGYDNITIKNAKILQGNASTYSIGSSAIYGSGMENSTINNNTITVYGTDSGQTNYGIYFNSSSNSNTISDNTINAIDDFAHGIRIEASSSNRVTGNNITALNYTGSGIILASSSTLNVILNNDLKAFGSGGYGILILSSGSNNVTGGSIVSRQSYDYYLVNASTTNLFTNTNFSEKRRIYFFDNDSYFNYNNQTGGSIWLKTAVSNATETNRTLVSWNNTLMQWNDTNSTAGITANYTITGLLPGTVYGVYNTSGGAMNKIYALPADANGDIQPFAIALGGNTEINVSQDLSLPSYSNAGVNATQKGASALFSTYWLGSNLSGFIFSTNNSGAWANNTWQPMTGAGNWSSATVTLNNTAGINVGYVFYANSTYGWNDTGVQTITIACTESWSYSAWSTCSGGTQTRTATDANSCGTTTGRSALSQSCSPGGGGGDVNTTVKSLSSSVPGGVLKTISVEFKTSITNPSIVSQLFASAPVSAPSSPVYQYISITKTNFKDSDIRNASFEFTVNKSWISSNGISEIYAARYDNGWNKLDTTLKSSDSNYNTYKAYTPGFSYFAIIGEKAAAIPPAADDTMPPEVPPASQDAERAIGEAAPESAPAPMTTGGPETGSGDRLKTLAYATLGIILLSVVVYVAYKVYKEEPIIPWGPEIPAPQKTGPANAVSGAQSSEADWNKVEAELEELRRRQGRKI